MKQSKNTISEKERDYIIIIFNLFMVIILNNITARLVLSGVATYYFLKRLNDIRNDIYKLIPKSRYKIYKDDVRGEIMIKTKGDRK